MQSLISKILTLKRVLKCIQFRAYVSLKMLLQPCLKNTDSVVFFVQYKYINIGITVVIK